MANLKTEVILTMNGKAVINVLELMKQKAAETKAEMDRVGKDSELYKPLKEQYDAFSSAHESTIKSTERLQHAVQNLSTTSLQNLRRALGAGKRDLQKLSEAQLAEADSIREMMRIVGNQIRLLEGQYVKIPKGLADLSSQSDQWLSKAIAQQIMRQHTVLMQLMIRPHLHDCAALTVTAEPQHKAAVLFMLHHGFPFCGRLLFLPPLPSSMEFCAGGKIPSAMICGKLKFFCTKRRRLKNGGVIYKSHLREWRNWQTR